MLLANRPLESIERIRYAGSFRLATIRRRVFIGQRFMLPAKNAGEKVHIPHDPVQIVEVGPRDGLQNLKTVMPTDQKVALIRHLSQSGIKQIQIGSFVSPRAIPQFHDIKAVAKAVLATIDGIDFSALTPNLKGAENALDSGLKRLAFVFSVSEAHNRSNVGKSPEASLVELEKIMQRLTQAPDVHLNVDLATAFGCPFTRVVPSETVMDCVKRVCALGVKQVTLCDTVGYGNPRQVTDLILSCRGRFPDVVFRCHFHNTRGMGLANALAAYMAGVRSFDASIGGLGGCPHAPGATGNISTEDLAFMCSEMNIATGIDLNKLFVATSYLTNNLPGLRLESQLFRAWPHEHQGERPCY
jgi:hydroxymethylglutaryl-CoA lyase